MVFRNNLINFIEGKAAPENSSFKGYHNQNIEVVEAIALKVLYSLFIFSEYWNTGGCKLRPNFVGTIHAVGMFLKSMNSSIAKLTLGTYSLVAASKIMADKSNYYYWN